MLSSFSVEELCKKLRPVFGSRVDALYLRYTLAENTEARLEIEQVLNILYRKHLNESLLNDVVMLESPEQSKVSGEYPIAKISYADRDVGDFCLRERDWPRHVCISGMSGSGKTTLAFQILKVFIEKNKPFIVFDWKRSFRPLLLVDEGILCFTVGNSNVSNHFRININVPPKNIDPREWLNLLCDTIVECFSASYGVHKLISETMDKAFRDFGVYDGSKNYPTWYQIKDRLEERMQRSRGRTRETEWLISALRIAHVLTFGNFGEAINNKDRLALGIEEMLNKRVIFELDSLSNIEKKFFCWFILTYIYKTKKVNSVTCDEFRNAIVVDEAHNIFLKNKPSFIDECITDVIYREIREYGVGLVCLDQHISKLSDTVAGNSACNIAFQQMLPMDIESITGIMQLREKRRYFSMLPVGSAIVKITERYYSPFLIKVPFTELKSVIVEDSFVLERMSKLMGMERLLKKEDINIKEQELQNLDSIFRRSGVKPDRGFIKKQAAIMRAAEKAVEEHNEEKKVCGLKNHIQEYLASYIEEQLRLGFGMDSIKDQLYKHGYKRMDIITSIKHVETSCSLTKEQLQFLHTVRKFPNKGTAEIYKKLGISARKGNALKQNLVEKGLVKVVEMKTEKGRKKTLTINGKPSEAHGIGGITQN